MNRRIQHLVGPALVLALTAGGLIPRAVAADPQHSQLWGAQGELWSPDSRLPDFSFAGYQRGEQPLPTAKPEVSVKDFGAVGDGRTDDTAAFHRAISEAAGKTIGVPAGRYIITDFLRISASGTVLKGEGPGRSVLYFPVPLEKIKPNLGATTGGQPTSNYSWSGGFVDVRGQSSSKLLSNVTAPAQRGSFELAVENPERFEVGADVRLVQRDTPENTLARHFYAEDCGPIENLKGRARGTFLARVAAVDTGNGLITLDRPLRTDVRAEWQPRLYPASSSVEEVGIEGLTFEFPDGPYEGHFTELGFNAVALGDVRNCWVRDIVIRHADSGIFVRGHNNTLTGITLESTRRPDRALNCTGHHGITLGGTDNLLDGFTYDARFIHDITVTSGSAGNVTMNGRGVDLALDHHRYGPHANLYTALDAGAGTRLFRSGGGAALGWHSGAWETFWNIRTARPQDWPSAGARSKWGSDLMNLVGLSTNRLSERDPKGRWFEAIRPDRLEPANLYEAQRQRRLGSAER